MRNRRLAIAGAALVTIIGLSGCGPQSGGGATGAGGTTASQEAPRPPDPAAERAPAATKLEGE